jgi:hypothetical protein
MSLDLSSPGFKAFERPEDAATRSELNLQAALKIGDVISHKRFLVYKSRWFSPLGLESGYRA